MTDIRKVQTILFGAMRKAARHVDQDAVGASILMICMGEAMAAIATELAVNGTRLREPGGPEKVIRSTMEPIEQMLRENIAEYLAQEAKATRQ